MIKILMILFLFFSKAVSAEGYDIFSVGYYDIKFDGTSTKDAADYRYERRFDKSLIQIGPEDYDFFDVKPFVGLEVTSSSATYFLAGIYLDDNVGTLLTGETSNFLITPSFGVDGLRYAMSITVLVNIWCAMHYWWCMKTIKQDFARAPD